MRKGLWLGVAVVAVVLILGGGVALAAWPDREIPQALAEEQIGYFGTLDSATLNRVATALGITPAELGAQLQAGKTIAQVAKDKGVDTAKLIDAIVAPYKARLESQTSFGYFTQAQADQLLAQAKEQASLNITRTFTTPYGGYGPGGGYGPYGSYEDMASQCPMMGGSGTGYGPGGMMGGGGMMGRGMMGGWGSPGSSWGGRGFGWGGQGFGQGFGRGMMGGWW